MNERNKKKGAGRIVTGLLTAVLIFILSIGLIGIILYKSGEAGLRASASSEIPVIQADMEETQKIKENLQTVLPWQDNWVAYEDKVYEYNEDTLNFLLMGIDHKGQLNEETDLSDWSAGQADTIFLVSMNQKERKVSIIGIPRNSMVEVEIYNEEKECIDTIYNQICLQYGYAGGGELGLSKMKQCVSELMYQLPIHGVCAISLDAISILTDMLGGVEVTVPDDMTPYRADYVKGARVELTGDNVENYLRYRDSDTLGSPTTRLTRQKEFLHEAILKGISQLKKDPMLVRDMYQSIVPYMNTDITLDKAVYLAAQMIDYHISSDSFYQLTGEDREVDYTSESGQQDFFDDYYLDDKALQQVIMKVFYEEVVLPSESQ